MTKIAIYAAIAFVVIAIAGGWYAKQQYDAEQRGIAKQVAADIAKANQNIATRRETDAHFDKFDAAAVCREFGREWVFADGKSECH